MAYEQELVPANVGSHILDIIKNHGLKGAAATCFQHDSNTFPLVFVLKGMKFKDGFRSVQAFIKDRKRELCDELNTAAGKRIKNLRSLCSAAQSSFTVHSYMGEDSNKKPDLYACDSDDATITGGRGGRGFAMADWYVMSYAVDEFDDEVMLQIGNNESRASIKNPLAVITSFAASLLGGSSNLVYRDVNTLKVERHESDMHDLQEFCLEWGLDFNDAILKVGLLGSLQTTGSEAYLLNFSHVHSVMDDPDNHRAAVIFRSATTLQRHVMLFLAMGMITVNDVRWDLIFE